MSSAPRTNPFWDKWRTIDGISTLFAASPKPVHCGMHQHPKPRISFLIRGAVVEVNGLKQAVETGDISLNYTPAGEMHAHLIQSPILTHLCADFEDMFFEEGRCERLPEAPAVFKSGPAITTMLRILAEINCSDTASDLVLQGLFLQLAGDITRKHVIKSAAGAPSWLRRATTHLRERALDNVSIEEVARDVGVDPSHLARVFRTYLNETPGDYLRKERLSWAAREIARGNKPFQQIAAESGYSDQSHFNKHFMSQMGVTPGQFRRAIRV